jgi:hypothetical protein
LGKLVRRRTSAEQKRTMAEGAGGRRHGHRAAADVVLIWVGVERIMVEWAEYSYS